MRKFALVLSGGGFKGAFQLGALKYLKDHWSELNSSGGEMAFSIIAGVSVGSLNGALVAADKFAELEQLWLDVAMNGAREIYTSDFIDTKSVSDNVAFTLDFETIRRRFFPGVNLGDISLWQKAELMFSKKQREHFLFNTIKKLEEDFNRQFSHFRAVADNTPLKQKLTGLLKRSDITDCIYKCGYVSLNDGNYYSVKHSDFVTDEDFINGILASTTMPIVWEPVREINTLFDKARFSVDGGVKNVSPLKDILEEITGEDDYVIIIINCSSGAIEHEDFENRNIIQIALRSLNDIAITEIFNNDLEQFLTINDLIKQIKKVQPDLDLYNYDYRSSQRTTKVFKPFKSILIQPALGVLGNTLVASKAIIERRIAHGMQKAQQALQQFLHTETT